MRLVAELVAPPGGKLSRFVVAADEEARTFARWVEGLPPAGHDGLLQLRAYGFNDRLDRLELQLIRALEAPAVPYPARTVGLRVLDILARRGDACCLLMGDELASCKKHSDTMIRRARKTRDSVILSDSQGGPHA